MNEDDDAPFIEVDRVRWNGVQTQAVPDRVAAEAPLEIRIGGTPIAVVMRTPGHDLDLVRGFLLTEGIASSPSAITSVRHCTTVDTPEAEDNVVQAVLDEAVDLGALRRNLYASSSCGVCGKASIDQAMAVRGAVDDSLRIEAPELYTLPERLEEHQVGFAQTGGLHAAALFDDGLQCLAVFEDVGRHNAVDKAVGAASMGDIRPSVLMVSGRVSFEIVQKALAAGIELIAAVSAPTSLAVELAARSGITLVGFLRERRMSVYSAGHRVVG